MSVCGIGAFYLMLVYFATALYGLFEVIFEAAFAPVLTSDGSYCFGSLVSAVIEGLPLFAIGCVQCEHGWTWWSAAGFLSCRLGRVTLGLPPV